MPHSSIARLARLTLFSGPQCSLCDIAKAELTKVRQSRQFTLNVVNIQDAGQERWKRKYVYWIPALHRRQGSRQGTLGRADRQPGFRRMGEKSASSLSGGGEGAVTTLEVDSLLYFSDVQRLSLGTYPNPDNPEMYWMYSHVSGAYADSSIVYHRHGEVILGASGDAEDIDDGLSRCFNCGSTTHLINSCPNPRNAALISLSRQLFSFFRPERASGEPATLLAASESKRERLHFLDAFVPGAIRGLLLREALDLREGDVGENVPWLKSMAEWGYPRGWAAREDPKEEVRRKVENQFIGDIEIDEGEGSFIIFGDDSREELDLSQSLNCHSPEDHSSPSDDTPSDSTRSSSDVDAEPTDFDSAPSGSKSTSRSGSRSPSPPLQRWACYPSTYFSSDLLPLYTGARLPPVRLRPTSTTYSNDRESLWDRIVLQSQTSQSSRRGDFADVFGSDIPPWRIPGFLQAEDGVASDQPPPPPSTPPPLPLPPLYSPPSLPQDEPLSSPPRSAPQSIGAVPLFQDTITLDDGDMDMETDSD
ncbi:hypothetical protein EW146_g3038 [Bondarzewia mesenterica]|uniref:CCHC-type domain-containing protein n=1 Tax=Bondarzewia mesenterica TaxID=1095465 RepID=A0A4S4LYR6_9AGAM|nr:hypothetical protein EW146_g3038 [Bondarzewia mesenterica]